VYLPVLETFNVVRWVALSQNGTGIEDGGKLYKNPYMHSLVKGIAG
jgi:hypothetical protein